jgi:hypothetical protein
MMSATLTASHVRAGDSVLTIPAYFTMMVAVMNVCMEQWYWTVPAVSNVWVKVRPPATT